MLHFVGLNNLTVIDADQQAFGAEAAQKSVEKAIQKLSAETEQCERELAISA